jgi:hypothetical protein
MSLPDHFAIVAIPLSRPEVVDFLLALTPEPRGAKLRIVGQRPTLQAESGWVGGLRRTPHPSITDLLAMDDPHTHLIQTHTDRLVPVESLAKPNFLTRDLGGWVSNYFGPVGLPPIWPDDPLLTHAKILTDYGPKIRFVGANPDHVAARLLQETGVHTAALAAAFDRLHCLRAHMAGHDIAYIGQLYAQLAQERCFASPTQPPLPDILLFDELLGQLVRLELTRRAALANGNRPQAEAIKAWQTARQQESGLTLILQGEYIIGRHRRSTVLIAPELGAVVKQPGPEPYHEIELGAKFVQGRKENWPYPTHDGSLVTARGRVRLTLEENLVPRLNHAFNHKVRYSTLMGLTIEPFVNGFTVQDWVLADYSRLTPELYQAIALHQLVCEVMGIENGDWHVPNFVRRHHDGEIVHIDWGAARPLRLDELTPAGRQARFNQVSNMAFSFQNQGLADRLLHIHAELVADEPRMAHLWQQAQAIADK